MERVLPVIRVLPPLRCVKVDKNYVLSRDITQCEWKRMQRYARRVREVHFIDDHAGPPEIAPSVWTFLARWVSPGQGLLPRLRCLTGLIVAEADPGHILLFCPSL
ncbi:uncharacterized protein TRAVEDRAFT_31213, partial [Trametes versicolor FP-101664 SS1]|uniref:uncharacterized protein n=1 Tax=Trametes versicolor (strain FP-101664) TaxID=717944 RepID=UPI0004621DB3